MSKRSCSLSDLIGFNLLHIFEHIKDLITYLSVKMDMEKYINNFIYKRVEEAIKYISKKEFEDNIRKIIIYNLENKKIWCKKITK